MSGKVQVTFAVRASQDELPLGQPVALVFLASDGDLAKLTFLVPCGDANFIRQAWRWPKGHLRVQVAEEISRLCADGIWERLLMTEGIQEELADLWQPVSED